jgi:hypothetical protein
MTPPLFGRRHFTHADCGLAIPRGGTSAVERVASYPWPPNLLIKASATSSSRLHRGHLASARRSRSSPSEIAWLFHVAEWCSPVMLWRG